jgi:hypothetical protein
MKQDIQNKLRDLLTGMVEEKEWGSMVNDIERYQKIKKLVITAFEAVTSLCPYQIRIVIESKIEQFNEQDAIYEFSELESFLKLVHISATSILSTLDNKKIDDYAAPHQAFGHLDSLVRINETGDYSESNVSSLGAAISVELEMFQKRLDKIDWKKGWDDKDEEEYAS